MQLLNNAELSVLERYTSRELSQWWQGMERKLAAKDTITIVNTGLVNSGKSSLFNALLDAFETERFPVGAVRTTMHGDRERLNDWVEIIDTPGIDATDEDDETAFHTLMEADLIVVTHNIKTGPLNRSEYEWLRRIANGVAKTDRERRITFICTWIDERDREDGYLGITAEVKRQVTEAMEGEIPFWEVSAKRYSTAHRKGIEAMAAASKIPVLKDFLLQRAAQARTTAGASRREELAELCRQSEAELSARRESLAKQVDAQEEKIRRRYQPAFNTWKGILKHFRSMRNGIEDMLEELVELKELWDIDDDF